jgi:hypothetical protein
VLFCASIYGASPSGNCDTTTYWTDSTYMYFNHIDPLVPDVEEGFVWDLREMGSAWRKGVREGPAPQEAGKISNQCSTRAETTWARTRKANQVGGLLNEIKLCNYDF